MFCSREYQHTSIEGSLIQISYIIIMIIIIICIKVYNICMSFVIKHYHCKYSSFFIIADTISKLKEPKDEQLYKTVTINNTHI